MACVRCEATELLLAALKDMVVPENVSTETFKRMVTQLELMYFRGRDRVYEADSTDRR